LATNAAHSSHERFARAVADSWRRDRRVRQAQEQNRPLERRFRSLDRSVRQVSPLFDMRLPFGGLRRSGQNAGRRHQLKAALIVAPRTPRYLGNNLREATFRRSGSFLRGKAQVLDDFAACSREERAYWALRLLASITVMYNDV